LRDNAELINSCLVYKQDTDKLVLTKYEGNQDITLKWGSREACLGNVAGLQTNEAEDIELINFYNRDSLFYPQMIRAKVPCTWARFNELKFNLLEKKRGYINIDGNNIFPLDISFSIEEKIGMIEVKGLRVNTDNIGYILQENSAYLLQENNGKLKL
jgi:hypothetical protein